MSFQLQHVENEKMEDTAVTPASLNNQKVIADQTIILQMQSHYGNQFVQRRLRNFANGSSSSLKKNGLPTKLRTGIEALSGLTMDDVTVSYNSTKPQQLGALAFTQGTEIHLAPGQEKHLPHEAWHVVQQKQGRVRPTTQIQGIPVNDAAELEREANRMGAQAAQMKIPIQKQSAWHAQTQQKGQQQQHLSLHRGGQKVGSADVAPNKDNTAELTNLKIAASQRKNGGGQEILNQAAEAARAMGKSTLRLESQDNGSGRLTNWYEKQGFQRKGIGPHGLTLLERTAVQRKTNNSNSVYPLHVNTNPSFQSKAANIAQRMEDPREWEPVQPDTEEEINNLGILKILGRNVAQYNAADQYKFTIWQKQLSFYYRKWEEGEKSNRQAAEIAKFANLINQLNFNDDETPDYDDSWKTKNLTKPIEVDSDGRVVGATISLPSSSKLETKNVRKRLTVSKARHMWDYMDADTNEPNNSLLPRKTDLSSVEKDILELAQDLQKKFIDRTHKEAYIFTTSNKRNYKVNKTDNDYPHCFPVDGADVVPMDRDIYNFILVAKNNYDKFYQGGPAGKESAWKAIKDNSLEDRSDEMIDTVMQLNLHPNVIETIVYAYADGKFSKQGGDPHAKLRGKGKKTKPRKQGETHRKQWNE